MVIVNVNVKDGTLTLRTSSFRAGMGSLLHSGVFTPELTSSLASAAVIVVLAAGALLAGFRITLAYFIGAVVLFVIFFMFLRRHVFYEEYLELKIDKASDEISVVVNKFMGQRRTRRLADLKEVKRGQVILKPENPDGVDFVAKIAIQHGTLVPGFGEAKTFSTVELVFTDGSKEIVFSSENEAEAKEVGDKLRGFIRGGVAEKG